MLDKILNKKNDEKYEKNLILSKKKLVFDKQQEKLYIYFN